MRALSKRAVVLLVILTMLASFMVIPAFAEPETQEQGTEVTVINKEQDYEWYQQEHSDAARPQTETVLSYADHLVLNSDGTVADDKLPIASFTGEDGVKDDAVVSDTDKTIGWKVNIKEAGFYNLQVKYFTFKEFEYETSSAVTKYTSKGSAPSRMVYIDGKLPFYEARQFQLSRLWRNENPVVKDEYTQNDIRPFQVEQDGWQTAYVRDYLGYFADPLAFYFTAGEHIISFPAISESFAINSVTLCQYTAPAAYSEIKAGYEQNGYTNVPDNDDTYIKIQAENPTRKSEPTLYAIADRSSPSLEPYHVSKIRLNSIGGEKWQDQGTWMEWSFDVKTAGLYKMAFKAKQNIVSGTNAYRCLSIDGKQFSADTQMLAFGYTPRYAMYPVGGEDACLFYFTEGTHTIRLDVTLGKMSPILQTAQESLNQLNAAYRQILMLTGTSPDLNRDYQFKEIIPEAIQILQDEYNRLGEIEEALKAAFDGKDSEQTGAIRRMMLILESMLEKEDNIKERFTAYKDSIASLGTWINDMREQPLQMDYIVVCSPDREFPAGEAGFFDRMVHEISSFFASFVEDYDTIGSVNVGLEEEPVLVWVETGAGNAGNRDNANVLKQIIDSRFTQVTQIPINLRLVAGGALLPATLAGNGPDVCLSRGSSDAVNFALRGAVCNLNTDEFEGKEEVFSQFYESALEPLRFRSGLFGLPETQNFEMLYYRTDVLQEMNIDPETELDTWDDIYRLLPKLQNKQMNFGMPVPVLGVVGASTGIYTALLYQNGGQLYQMSDEYPNDGITSDLETDVALDAFKMWTNMFVVNRLPNSYDFANRFRSGEVPVAIAGYSSYNLLSVFAPEIDGLWSFRNVPGTKRTKEDGTQYVDYTTAGSVGACVMLSTCKNRTNAWKFMSWWVGTEAQALFGREIESMLGSAARYQTANVAAVEQLPWDKKSYEAIIEQWKFVRGIPEVPGSYYTMRNIEFAWKEVISTSGDSNLILLDYSKIIKDEIARKREEFKDRLRTDVDEWPNNKGGVK